MESWSKFFHETDVEWKGMDMEEYNDEVREEMEERKVLNGIRKRKHRLTDPEDAKAMRNIKKKKVYINRTKWAMDNLMVFGMDEESIDKWIKETYPDAYVAEFRKSRKLRFPYRNYDHEYTLVMNYFTSDPKLENYYTMGSLTQHLDPHIHTQDTSPMGYVTVDSPRKVLTTTLLPNDWFGGKPLCKLGWEKISWRITRWVYLIKDEDGDILDISFKSYAELANHLKIPSTPNVAPTHADSPTQCGCKRCMSIVPKPYTVKWRLSKIKGIIDGVDKVFN